jgi:orotate phosphoribosyltransferase/AMMECR1 domain-containing protein
MNTLSEKKARLLSLIVRDGILYRTPTQPVLSRDGTSGRWMLDSLCVSLSYEGLNLAAACLLDLLGKFEGRQIATYGTTAIPLLTACIMQSGGRYEGLLVRKERKAHGSRKLVEGRARRDEPVILIDDSVSSGISMQQCRDILEAEGFRVEGGICLVRFDWYGGFALMQEQGYHMETLFDVDRDIVPHLEDEPRPVLNPSKRYPQVRLPWHTEAAPEGLSPTELARKVLAEFLSTGKLLFPPETLDQDYAHQGGCYVSLRERDNIHVRPARDGFWHFPGEPVYSAAKDVVLASWQTGLNLPHGDAGLAILERCGIAVTLFSRLEACQVGDLDNNRYGIVVRSNERPDKMGGALPRMPGIATSGQQFQYAYKSNAGLISFEPYTLYRHDVTKIISPDIAWQESGVAQSGVRPYWYESLPIARAISGRARAYVNAIVTGQEVSGEVLPDGLCPELDSLYLTILSGKRLLGCMGKQVTDMDADLRILAEAALHDERFANTLTAEELGGLTVKISLLYSPLELGAYQPDEIMMPVRFAEQALMVYQGEREALLLPDWPVTAGYDEKGYVEALLDKAGITEGPYAWRRYECSTWLDDGQDVQLLEKGFPRQSAAERDMESRLPLLCDQWAGYIQRQQTEQGNMHFYYQPFAHQVTGVMDNVRAAHAAWVLLRARQQGMAGVDTAKLDALLVYLKGFVQRDAGKCWLAETANPAERRYDTLAGASLLLMALSSQDQCSLEDASLAAELAETLWGAIGQHGRIGNYIYPDAAYPQDAYQDYIPGQVLLALALACQAGLSKPDVAKLKLAQSCYWHRFQYKRRADQISWFAQAWVACWQMERRPEWLEQAHAMCEWLVQFQSQQDGGFTTWQQSDGRADYLTAVYLEAIAAVASAMHTAGHEEWRYRNFVEACQRGFCFLDSLTVQERDKSVLPYLEWAQGGVRQSQVNSTIRVDFNQHALSAGLYFSKNSIHSRFG